MRTLLCVVCAVLVLSGAAHADPATDPGTANEEARRLFEQGLEHSRRQQWELAIQAYRRAVQVDPRFVEAWTNLGYAYRKVKDYERSVEAYQRALSLRPDHAQAHDYLARTYLAMGNREAAMRHYEILRRLDPRMAERLLHAIRANDPELESSGY
jgi:tetratricopeptide (TPR) repeat protein